MGTSIALALTLLAPAISDADTRPNSSQVQSNKSEIDIYKQEMQTFRLELQKYEEARRAINSAYKVAIDRVMAETRVPKDPNISQLQKRQNFASRRNAVIAATSIRDAAMASLGEGPTPPLEPTKQAPGTKNRKPLKQARE